MVHHIMFCPKCKRYTLSEYCEFCDTETISPKPAKFSLEDHYAEYRRKAKEEKLRKEGLL